MPKINRENSSTELLSMCGVAHTNVAHTDVIIGKDNGKDNGKSSGKRIGRDARKGTGMNTKKTCAKFCEPFRGYCCVTAVFMITGIVGMAGLGIIDTIATRDYCEPTRTYCNYTHIYDKCNITVFSDKYLDAEPCVMENCSSNEAYGWYISPCYFDDSGTEWACPTKECTYVNKATQGLWYMFIAAFGMGAVMGLIMLFMMGTLARMELQIQLDTA